MRIDIRERSNASVKWYGTVRGELVAPTLESFLTVSNVTWSVIVFVSEVIFIGHFVSTY